MRTASPLKVCVVVMDDFPVLCVTNSTPVDKTTEMVSGLEITFG